MKANLFDIVQNEDDPCLSRSEWKNTFVCIIFHRMKLIRMRTHFVYIVQNEDTPYLYCSEWGHTLSILFRMRIHRVYIVQNEDTPYLYCPEWRHTLSILFRMRSLLVDTVQTGHIIEWKYVPGPIRLVNIMQTTNYKLEVHRQGTKH